MELGRNFLEKTEILPVIRTKTAERKYVEETATAEQYQQGRAESPSWNGISQKDDKAAEEVEP